MEKLKNNKKYIISTSFLFIIFFLFAQIFIIKDTLVSKDERRYLAQFESLEFENLLNGSFSSQLETYLMDQFPNRSFFRELKSFSSYKIFMKQENNDIATIDNSYIKLETDYNYDKIPETIKKINQLKQKYFFRNKCYFTLIPDKSSLVSGMDNLVVDYDKVETLVLSNLDKKINYIEVKDNLSLNNYYKTDSHWKQSEVVNIADLLNTNMNKKTYEVDYKENIIENFKGVYASHAALTETDNIVYLTNDIIDNCTVYDYENNKNIPVYNLDKLTDEKSMDNYDIFLSGSVPLLKIENPVNKTNDTLIVFRDSFGSSLVPLLIEEYNTIYVVDLRYMSAKVLTNYIDITGREDVLFMYSTMMINLPENVRI